MSKALELAKHFERSAAAIKKLDEIVKTTTHKADRYLETAAELRRLAAVEQELERIRAAVKNLHKVKGRFHTEQAYKALIEACGLTPKD